MKAFYIILIILMIMLFAILACGARIKSFTENATEKLQTITLSESAEGELEEFKASVDDFIKEVEFAISRKRSDLIRDYSSLLIIQAKQGNVYEFEATKALLINLLKDVSELESFRLKSLL